MNSTATSAQSQKHDNVEWVDLENPDAELLKQLEQEYHLHPVHLQESLQKVQHIQVEHEENYLFLVLHAPIADALTGKITITQIGMFLGRDFLITIRSGACPSVTDLFGRSQQHQPTAKQCFKRGSSYLLFMVIDVLLDGISAMTDEVVGELDDLEDLVFDNNKSDAERIGKVRQKIVRLRRVIGPKRIVLQDLAERIDSFSGQAMSKHYSNNTKTVHKLWEEIEEAKETVEIFKDADFTTSTEQTNKILTVLTLVFTFTIPVTVVASLYGTNVLLPGGLEAGNWAFLGRYTTFIVLLVVSAVLATAMYIYFKSKKWF
ncbi:MAG: magnesium transporter [Candidatus Saccharibacteria bacterium]|nr:magnesium transporter [Candidatus Saccharibacteria bacterium]